MCAPSGVWRIRHIALYYLDDTTVVASVAVPSEKTKISLMYFLAE